MEHWALEMSSFLIKSYRTCLLFTTLAFVWLTPIVVAQPIADNTHIPRLAGGRSQFVQQGQILHIPSPGSAAQEVLLLPQMRVNTVAQQGTETWISGRSNAQDLNGLFVASIGANGQIIVLPTPPDREQPRGAPTFLVDQGKVTGLVWLEGERQETLSIRASRWNGTAWSPVEVISPSRGKEQTGLTATVLTDGSWLVVWAAVDTDDDLWWSRRTRQGWSEPQRLHSDNDVPDITPALISVPGGALAAWSQYDGNDYRIRLAKLQRSRWTTLPLRTGKGAVEPKFLSLGDAIGILYSEVIPEAWTLVRLNPDGSSVGRRSIETTRSDRPLIVETQNRFTARWLEEQSEMQTTADPEP